MNIKEEFFLYIVIDYEKCNNLIMLRKYNVAKFEVLTYLVDLSTPN